MKILLFALFLIMIPTAIRIGGYACESSSAQVVVSTSPTPPIPTPKYVDQARLWGLVNEWRISQGKRSYLLDSTLCKYAEVRTEEIKSDWSHNGFLALKDEIYKKYFYARLGENLSMDFDDEFFLLAGWLNSPTHREILDLPHTHSCIRCSENYCVQLFGKY